MPTLVSLGKVVCQPYDAFIKALKGYVLGVRASVEMNTVRYIPRKKQDPYASEEDTLALLRKDTRTDSEQILDRMMDERGANEQGAEPYVVLRQIALELLDQRA